MKKQQINGLISLAVMVVLSVAVIFGSNGLYSSIRGTYKYSAGEERLQKDIDKAIANANGSYTPGTYEATEYGYEGDVTVKVVVSDKAITDIIVDAPNETPAMGGKAIKTIRGEILKAQSVDDVDSVSGATFSSDAMIKASKTAISKAKG